MDFGHYRLIGPLSAGHDGARYRARDTRDDSEVEIRVLNGLRNRPDRARAIDARLRSIKLLDHPSVRGLILYRPDAPAPYHILERSDGPTLAELVSTDPGRSMGDWIHMGRALADAVEAGHRVGLAHGTLSPATIRLHPTRGPVIDWTAVEVDTGAWTSSATWRKSCRAPESTAEDAPTPEADRYALGSILSWLVTGRFPIEGKPTPLRDFPGLFELIAELTSLGPAERATARDASRRLESLSVGTRPTVESTRAFVQSTGESLTTKVYNNQSSRITLEGGETVADSDPIPTEEAVEQRSQLGRYKMIERLGQGGMGSVYLAEDLVDGSRVALKVLRPKWAAKPQALKRFLKEARLLREINSPYVTNFIEVNEDRGVYFLALEYVAGSNLTEWMRERRALDERTALSLASAVARALGVAHERGIVHRDVKPDNILVLGDPNAPGGVPTVKLSDFGIAKALTDGEATVLTRYGTLLGTPLYMSPEQCAGEEIGPWSDVYSLGATLFHMLTGRPPFEGESPVTLIHKHRNEAPPNLLGLNRSVSEGASRLVTKCLAKLPADRYADALELLADLERLLRGEPTAISVHPVPPAADADNVVAYDWTWRLQSPPEKLWPHVSNTERLNRAAGMSPVEFRDQPEEAGGVRREGSIRRAGMNISWREHPFEWVEGRRLGVLREYASGPFEWLMSIVELEPTADGGTNLTHRVRVASKGIVGKGIAAVEIGSKGRKGIEAVYRRIDAAVSGKLGKGADADPFEAASNLTGEPRRRIDRWMESLGKRGLNASLIEQLGDYVARAPVQELARIRPIALANRLELDVASVVDACLVGVAEGVLLLMWDLLCPVCRVPSRMIDTLRSLKDHASCEACRSEFKLDFGESVELVFRVHPEVRTTQVGTYCLGGPGNAPHVAVQARVAPGERLELRLRLPEGSYRLRGPQLRHAVDFRVDPGAKASRWDLDLGRGPDSFLPNRLRSRDQVLHLSNTTERELLVRIERIAPRVDALTAARAAGMPLFRSLFPGELLEPGRLIARATVTLLVTELPDAPELYAKLGDAAAFARIHEYFRAVEELTRKQGGTFVKTIGEGAVAAFDDAADALLAALSLPNYLKLSPNTIDLVPRIGLHRGSAMIATLNDRLDYFGATARLALALPAHADPGGIAMTSGLASDPKLSEIIASRGRRVELVAVDLPELSEGFIQHVSDARSVSKARRNETSR